MTVHEYFPIGWKANFQPILLSPTSCQQYTNLKSPSEGIEEKWLVIVKLEVGRVPNFVNLKSILLFLINIRPNCND